MPSVQTLITRHPAALLPSAKQQAGIALLEILISVVLLGLVIAGAATLVDNHLEKLRINVAAQQMQVFAKGVNAFIKDNYPYLVAANDRGLIPASDKMPTVLTVDILRNTPHPESGLLSSARYLPNEFPQQNSFQQTLCALVLQPQPNELYAMIIAEGGQRINDADLSLFTATLGASGGGIYTDNPDLAKGALGKWEFNLITDEVGQYFAKTNCAGELLDPKPGDISRAGRPLMALWFSADPAADFLYRSEVPGHPELNTLQTDLKFRDDFVDESDKDNPVFSGGASMQLQIVREPGEICDDPPTAGAPIVDEESQQRAVPPGTLARTEEGELLSCQLDETSGKRTWARIVSAGRWEFFLVNPDFDWFSPTCKAANAESSGACKKVIGTGYLIDNEHFSGTLHCVTKSGFKWACGESGNVDCKPGSIQKAMRWNNKARNTPATSWIGNALKWRDLEFLDWALEQSFAQALAAAQGNNMDLDDNQGLGQMLTWAQSMNLSFVEREQRRCAWFFAGDSIQECERISGQQVCSLREPYQVDTESIRIKNPVRKW